MENLAGDLVCPFCYKKYTKFGIKGHIWRAHGKGREHNPLLDPKNKQKIVDSNKRRKPWNKGLTKETNEQVAKISQKLSDNIQKGLATGCCTKEYIGSKEHRDASARGGAISGGYRKRSGRGKSGWYKGIWCDSSWELAFVFWNLDHNIPIRRNTEKFEYTFQGKTYKYIPDFLIKNQLVEVKAYWNEQQVEKIKQCPKSIEIIDKTGIEQYINYVVNKHGKCYTSLYGE